MMSPGLADRSTPTSTFAARTFSATAQGGRLSGARALIFPSGTRRLNQTANASRDQKRRPQLNVKIHFFLLRLVLAGA